LRKDIQTRVHHIGDARIEIHDCQADVATSGKRFRRRLAMASALSGLAVVLALMAWRSPGRTTNLIGAQPTRLTFDAGLQTDPSFSPDGRSIVYASSQSDNFDLWTKPIDGEQPFQLTNDPAHDWQPDWSPNTNQVVFRSERDGGGLFLVPSEGGAVKRLTEFGFNPRWSSDGSHVLFVDFRFPREEQRVYTVALDGRPPRALPVLQAAINKGVSGVGWHPDGNRILFLKILNRVQLAVFDISSNSITRSSVHPDVERHARELRLRVSVNHQQFVEAAPDASALYFVGVVNDLASVWRLDLDPVTLDITGGPHPVTALNEPVRRVKVSRDGRRLAFDAAGYGRPRVAVYQLTPSGEQTTGVRVYQTPTGATAFDPDLTSDGGALVYLEQHAGAARRVHELRVVRLSDGAQLFHETTDLDLGELRRFPRWSVDGTRIALGYFWEGGSQGARSPTGAGPGFSIRAIDLPSGREFPITAASPISEAPYDWSRDGRYVVASSRRHTNNSHAIVLIPASTDGNAELTPRVIAQSTELGLWNTRLSTNGRWLCASATNGASSRLVIVRVADGALTPITDGSSWDDKPRWSPDGRLLYFLSDRGGLFNVWAFRFDPEGGRPVGDAFRVTNYTGGGVQTLLNYDGLELGVGGGRLALPEVDLTGGIWMLDNIKH
jgi:Tol biopolymer transport system component